MRAHEFDSKLHKMMAKEGMGSRPLTVRVKGEIVAVDIADIIWNTETEEFEIVLLD